MMGEFRLLSLLEFNASLPTPPDEDVVASSALCSGFPLMSCNVRIRGCCADNSLLGDNLARGVLWSNFGAGPDDWFTLGGGIARGGKGPL